MEFLTGAIVSMIAIVLGQRYLKANTLYVVPMPIMSQSTKFQALKFIYWYGTQPEKTLETQATKFSEKHSVRVLFTEDKAYWIHDNSVYEADIDDFGQVDQDSSRVVDIMAMDAVQLEEIKFIIDKLNEGKRNDSWGSGNS